MVGALVSGLAQRSMLSLAALFVLAGFVLGNGGLGWIDFRARSGFVEDLAFAALIVILFRDGLEVEGEMLQRAWHLPLRKLVLAMPITTMIVAAAARVLIGLSWTESFLLGALLAPTDPVLTSSIVTNPRVPRLVRHSLNLESGLNDGLALPAVLALLGGAERRLGQLRVVALRAAGHRPGPALRPRLRLARLAADAARERAAAGAARSPPTRSRCSRSASRSRPTA